MSESPGLSYRDAGVDIDAGNQLVDQIKADVASTRREEVLGGIGGFGALFRVPTERYREPVLVSGTDGVGTKLRLAIDAGRYEGIGIDLVAMCVNDVLVQGAEPLFFLDYYATARLDNSVAAQVIRSIAEGCKQSGCALVGGETAEMPGMYQPGDFDLAGFCVAIAERDRLIDGSGIRPGNVILGVHSSGPHSNGYSLIRKVLEVSGAGLDHPLGDGTLGDALLAPTRLYVKSLLPLAQSGRILGMAHITGGGLPENLPRVLPEDCCAEVDVSSWERPPVFQWLQEQGRIEEKELLRTFNCGIGMAVVVEADAVESVLDEIRAAGETAQVIGEIVPRNSGAAAFRNRSA